jgi:hypothetical protein
MKVTDSSGGSRPRDDDAVLSRVCQSAVSVMAITAHRSGVSPDRMRAAFASLARTGFGLSPAFEAAVLSELAALGAGSP